MIYRIDLTEPDYFWQLRKIERELYGKTTSYSSTVRRVDSPSGDRQGSPLWGELRSANVGLRLQQEGTTPKQDRGDNLLGFHEPYRDYGG